MSAQNRDLEQELNWIRGNTLGLPDFWLVDDEGRPSIKVLRQRLDVDRTSYRSMKGRLEKWVQKIPLVKLTGERDYLLDSLCHPKARTSALVLAIKTLNKSRAQGPSVRGEFYPPSWEVVIFHKYHNCFYSKPADASLVAVFDGLESDKVSQLKEDYRRDVLSRLAPIWSELLEELKGWESMAPDRRRFLADVAFGFLAPVGPKALLRCIEIAPALVDFYTFARTYPLNLPNPGIPVPSEPDTPPATLKAFYEHLQAEVARGLEAPGDLSIAKRLEAYVNAHLSDLMAKPILTDNEQVEIAERFIIEVVSIGKALELRDLQIDEGCDVVNAAWRRHLDTEFRSPIEMDWLIMLLEEIHARKTKYADELVALKVEQDRIASELERLDEQLVTARFGRRQALEEERQGWLKESALVARTLSDTEAKSLEALLPEGITYADLEGLTTDVAFEPANFDPSVAVALVTWVDHEARREAHEEDYDGVVVAEPELAVSESPDASCTVGVTESPDQNVPAEEIPPPEGGSAQELLEGQNRDDEFGNSSDVEEGCAPDPSEMAQATVDADLRDEGPIAHPGEVSVVETEDMVSVAEQPETLSSYQLDSESAGRQYLEAYARRAPDLGVAIENIAFKWLAQGHLNLAYATLRAGRGMDYWIEPTVSPDLFRAAYFGLNVWSREADSLVTCQRLLNPISVQEIDAWGARRPGGKAVAYLVFAATFQPSLFGGTFTPAPILLDYVAEHLPTSMQKLAKEVVTASRHNLNVSLDALSRTAGTEDKEAGKRLAVRLSDWQDRITSKQTGWAPIRKALTDCLERDDFLAVIRAVRGENSDRAAVLDFVNHYTDPNVIQSLLETQLEKVNRGGPGVIGRSAISWFTHSVVDLRTLATDWLVENRARQGGQDDLRDFRERLSTLLRAALDELKAQAGRSQDLDLRAGIQIAIDCLSHLRSTLDGRSESIIWSSARAEAWFRLPQDLMAMDGVPNDGVEQMKWLVERCGTGFDEHALTEAALQSGRFRVAHLMLLSRKDKGEAVEVEVAMLAKLRAKHFKSLEDRCSRLQTLIGDALIASLIDEEQSYRFGSEIEHIKEEIQRRGGDPFDDLGSVEDGLTDIEAQMEVDYQAKLALIEQDYQDQLRMMHAHLGPDSVSEQWQAVMRRAIDTRSLPVTEEMLDQLRNAVKEGTRIGDTPRWGNPHLAGFLVAQDRIYDAIKGQTDPRSFPRKLAQENGLDLDFGNRATALKEVAEHVIDWRSSSWTQCGIPQYQQLWKVLTFLGFRQKEGNTKLGLPRKLQKGEIFVSINVDIALTGGVRPFPLFGSLNRDGKLAVVIAFRDWRPDTLRVFLEDQRVIGPQTLLLSAVPMGPDLRNALAKSCKDHQQTLFHADLGMIIYLAAVTQDHAAGPSRRLRDFLMLSAPYTYYNPYLEGDARHPPPPEIRYGRSNEISRIMTMPGGTAIIFGGRQLGKTTILHEAQRRFHNPGEGRWSWYDQMDEGMRRGGSSREDWEIARKKVWTTVYHHLVQASAIKPETGADLETQIEAVKAEIQQAKSGQFLLVFDEVDRILEVDAVHGFGIFRGLSGLVNQPTGRFKLVIAGLENVKRFEDSPNFPLPQLGSSLQVSIMPTLDALALIREPLEVLGYEFEDELGANRILSAVNRHPGLLQIFAHELLKRLAASHKGNVGSRKISSDDITWVSMNATVRDQIRNRFNMTLDLDKRYLVIVYSLILAGRASSSFTVTQAKKEAQDWLPGAFVHLTEKQFGAFLGELVGLGVLRLRQAEGREEYALRSANILNLLGSQEDIAHKLEEAIQAFEDHDPLGSHAFNKQTQLPSPLSARDEKQILGIDTLGSTKCEEKGFVRYSVALVTGSNALGLNRLIDFLPALYEFDPSAPGDGRSATYRLSRMVDTEKGLTAALLRDRLLTWMKGKGIKEPVIELIEITGNQPISHILDLLEMANKLGADADGLKYPLRIVFVLWPKALWVWTQATEMTKLRPALQAFVALDRWGDTALAQLLDNLGLNNATDDVAKLRAISKGWYFSLEILCELRKKRKQARWLSALSSYTPITEAKPAKLRDFLKDTGLEDVPWGVGLAQNLVTLGEDFDVELLRMLIEEQGYGLSGNDAEAVLDWLLYLKLIEPAPGKPAGTYAFERCLKVALEAVDSGR